MKFGRFQKIAAIGNSFTCESCPIAIKSGVILHDRFRNIQLLSLIVKNRGNVTVDEIEVKVISYDRYGNPVPEENGQVGQICRFTDSGCLPDQSIGDGDLILLPSPQVVSCDVMVTRVKTAGNVELFFDDSDYEVVVPDEPVLSPDAVAKNHRRRFRSLIIGLCAVVLVYCGIFVAERVIRTEIIPTQNEQVLQGYLSSRQYGEAIKQLQKMGDEARREAVINDAVDYYIGFSNYDKALSFASESTDLNKRYDTLCRIVDILEGKGKFDEALELAIVQNSRNLKKKVYSDAVDYYTRTADFRTALTWVARSGNVTLGDSVYRAAVKHYTLKGEFVTALDYALKTEDRTVILSVYNPAVLSLIRDGNYNSAALYIARCNLPNDTAITGKVKEETFAKADKSFIRLNAVTFWPTMTFSQKQGLFANVAAIESEIIAIGQDGSVITTAEWPIDVLNAVSVDISEGHAVVLRNDGTVLAVGDNLYRQCETTKWTNIVGVAAGRYHTVGLRDDGTVVASGNNDYGQCSVSGWTDIIQVVCGPMYTVGLKKDGTVVAVGRNNAGQCNVSTWSKIVQLSAGHNHTLGLVYGGTVVAAGVDVAAKCDVDDWSNVTAVAAGSTHSAALLSDGTVIVAGGNTIDITSVSWENVVLIAAGNDNVFGATEERLRCIGSGKISVSGLGDIRLP